MLSAHTPSKNLGLIIGTGSIIPVTNSIGRLNKEVKPRADGVGTFPNEALIMHPIRAVLFEQNDEWQTPRRSMMGEAFAQINKEEIDPLPSITTRAA